MTMQSELKIGTVGVTEDSTVVLILDTDLYSELDVRGRSSKYHEGLVISSPTRQPGSRWTGLELRPTTHISNLVELAKKSGVTFLPYQRAFADLTVQEQNAILLARLQA